MQECWEEAARRPSYRGQEEIQGEDVDMACDSNSQYFLGTYHAGCHSEHLAQVVNP